MNENIVLTDDKVISLIQSRKFLICFLICLILLFVIGWVVLVSNENRIDELDVEKVIFGDANNYNINLEDLRWTRDDNSLTDDYVHISGWIVKPGTNVDAVAIRVVLKDMETEKYYIVPTGVVSRGDVTESINDGKNYEYSGFSVLLPYWRELDTDKNYELYVQYELNDEGNVLVPMNRTLK